MQETELIAKVMNDGYIEGIHRQGNRELVEAHFHPEFSMFLRDEHDKITIMKIQEWLAKIEQKRKENPDSPKNKVEYTLRNIFVHENFATVLLDLYYNDKLYAVDQFSLYKIKGDWKLMAKLYEM